MRLRSMAKSRATVEGFGKTPLAFPPRGRFRNTSSRRGGSLVKLVAPLKRSSASAVDSYV